MLKKVLYIIVILILGNTQVFGQDNDIFSSYGVDDGLPQSTIWSIVEDRHGFLWIGTSDGVCRFDGYNFTSYRNDPKDSNSILGGLYFRFYKDSSSNLWIISQNGISLYNDVKDNFIKIFTYEKEYPSPNYNSIFGEDAQYIWAGISTYALIKIDKHTHKVVAIKDAGYANFSEFASWQSGFISKGKIWSAGSNTDCYVYDINTAKLNRIPVPYLYKIVDFNDSEVLAATFKELILFNKNDLSYKTIPFIFCQKSEGGVTDIFIESDSTIILTCPQGLFYVDTHSWKVTKCIQSFTRGQKRSYKYLQCIYKDISGNLWVGSNGDGLKKITAPYKRFKYYSSFKETGNLVKAIYADNTNLYVGYFDNGLDIFNKQTGFIRNVPLLSPVSPQNNLYTITSLDSSHLLFNQSNENFLSSYCLTDYTLSLLSPVISRVLPNFRELANSYPFFLKNGNIIYTVLGEYLISLDVSSPTNIRAEIVHQFSGNILVCAYKDSEGKIWVGALNGAFCIENETAKKIALPEVVLVKTINEDAKGNIWVGTIRGIYVLDNKGSILHYYSETNGLSNQFIYGILRDEDGNMWFSHNKGLSVYKSKTNTFRHYTKDDGLQSNEFNTGAYFKAADGELFFGGINGVNSFYPREIIDNPHAPKVVITSIQLFDQPLKTDTSYWNIHSLNFLYTQNSLSFEFAGIEFTNPLKNQYAYMMEGLDNDWINVGDKRFARYAALPPGNYTFKVKASNGDGTWQNTPTMIQITISPPFWQTIWFRLLCVLLLVGIITGIILLIQRQRHKRQIRAMELQQKIQLERERISRDLHDNVGTQLSLISNNIEWVTHPLKVISEYEKSDKLQFVNNTARDIISTLRETIWALNKEQISLEEFTDKLKAFTQKQLTIYPGIELDIIEDAKDTVILGPSEALNLFRICQEAITNALKYANATKITIMFQSNGEKYKISIADNGKGFDTNLVNPALQNGLENMKYRAKDILGILEIRTGIGEGTTITVTKK